MEAYASTHSNTLPATWDELAAWSHDTGARFSPADAKALQRYQIRTQKWIDTTAEAPAYISSDDGAIDPFASGLNHDIHLYLTVRKIPESR